MRWKFEARRTCSFCLAVAIFTIHINVPVVAKPGDKTENKRRQRLIFKMLATSPLDDEATAVNDLDLKEVEAGANTVPGRVHKHKKLNVSVGIIPERSDEPPLVSGSTNKQLVLTMVGKFKNTWCKTEPFMQLVKEPGCESRTVLNRFCYGQCNSFYIPRTLRKRTKRKVFKSCGFCKPKRTNTIIVTLRCPGKKKGFKHKKVRQVKQCQCMER